MFPHELAQACIGLLARLRLGQSAVRVLVGAPGVTPPAPVEARLHSLVGHAASTRALFAQLAQVAASDATVLLEGETGTGKEGAAEAVHLESARRDVSSSCEPSRTTRSTLPSAPAKSRSAGAS